MESVTSFSKLIFFNLKTLGVFPDGSVVKKLPANAGDVGSIPSPGESHMLQSNEANAPQLLSLHSRIHEPQPLSLCATTIEALSPYSPCS